MDITLLKLGGSLITDKSKPYTAKPEIIRQIFTEIKDSLKNNPDLHLIIGHGAGSFAHTSAKKYDTINGFTNNDGKFCACLVHTDAMKLHQIVIEEAIRVGLAAYSLQPSAFLLSENKKFYSANFGFLSTALINNMIPLLYGDVILDKQIGATIYSTDALFSLIAKVLPLLKENEFKINKIIHVGNYDGVLDGNGKVIPEINKTIFPKLKKYIGKSEHIDVTGGMLQKVQESLDIAATGIPSHIINGTIKGNISKALQNDVSFGTQIHE